MTAIQDKTLHEEITAMLNNNKGKLVVMEMLFPNIDVWENNCSDIRVSFKDDTCAYTNRIAVRIEWRKADFQSMETKIISFKEFEDLLLLV